MTAISDRYRSLAAEFTRRVEAVPADRWENPSPCAGWTARDLLRHLIESHRNMPGFAGITVEFTRSVDDDPVGAWHEARVTMQALLDDPATAEREYDGYFGRTSLQQTIDKFLGFDLLVHGWDWLGRPASTRRCRRLRSSACTPTPSSSATPSGAVAHVGRR